LNAPLVAFVAVLVLEGMLSAICLTVAYRKYPCKGLWTFTISKALRLVKESWPFILSGISIIIYMRIDQVMIKELLGIQKLGIYAAVLPLATLWQIIPMALNVSLAPFVARKKAESETAYWRAIEKIFKAYAILGWLIIFPTILLAPVIVPILFGDLYREGVLVLSIYVCTNIFINMGVAQNLWMLNERRALISIANTMVGAIVSIIGNYLLIPLFGIAGVAFVAVIAQLSSAVLINFIFAKTVFWIQIRSIFWPFFSLKGNLIA
jgi:PST family polysaccharide transporter